MGATSVFSGTSHAAPHVAGVAVVVTTPSGTVERDEGQYHC
jgi:subtilisin family serine protease